MYFYSRPNPPWEQEEQPAPSGRKPPPEDPAAGVKIPPWRKDDMDSFLAEAGAKSRKALSGITPFYSDGKLEDADDETCRPLSLGGAGIPNEATSPRRRPLGPRWATTDDAP